MANAAFDAAVRRASSQGFPSSSTSQKGALYGLYKQATAGDCDRPKPGLLDVEGRTKFNAWTAYKGLPQAEAKAKYCAVVAEIDPSFSSPGCSPDNGTAAAKASNCSSPRQSPSLSRRGSLERARPSRRALAKPPSRPHTALVEYRPELARLREKLRVGSAAEALASKAAVLAESAKAAEESAKAAAEAARVAREAAEAAADAAEAAAQAEEAAQADTEAQSRSNDAAGRRARKLRGPKKGGKRGATGLDGQLVGPREAAKEAATADQDVDDGVQVQSPRWAKYLDVAIDFLSEFLSFLCVLICLLRLLKFLFGSTQSVSVLIAATMLSISLQRSHVLTKLWALLRSRVLLRRGAGSGNDDLGRLPVAASKLTGDALSAGTGETRKPTAPFDESFLGVWAKNKTRSDSAEEHLIALGTPWAVRVGIARSNQTNVIECDGVTWTETTKSSIITQAQTLTLDAVPRENVNPLDRTVVVMVSTIEHHETEGTVVVTESTYRDKGIRQLLRRTIEEDGQVYHVRNQMTLADGRVLVADSYFDRQPER